jgi:protein gp37
MGAITKIQWTDYTFNLWRGCTKVSEGCLNCYAETLSKRNPLVLGEWGPGKPRVHAAASYVREPHKWNRFAIQRRQAYLMAAGDPRHINVLDAIHPTGNRRERVFTASLADILDTDGVPIGWLAELFGIVHHTPELDWLMLTKRPENFYPHSQAAWNWMTCQHDTPENRSLLDWLYGWGKQGVAPANVWFGITGENNKRLWERWGHAKIVKAKVHFLSLEPLLEDVSGTLATIIAEAKALGIRLWVIVGGESGPGARPFNVEWARRIVVLCRAAGVACFVKQLGSNPKFKPEYPLPPLGDSKVRDRKGGDPAEWPEDLRVREFPGDSTRIAT